MNSEPGLDVRPLTATERRRLAVMGAILLAGALSVLLVLAAAVLE